LVSIGLLYYKFTAESSVLVSNYTVVAAIVGVPQLSVRVAVAGGMNLHNTAGAVPKLTYGLAVSVPPEILAVDPTTAVPLLLHVVTKVSVVLPALTAAVTLIKLPV